MEKAKKISVEQCCVYYSIKASFVLQLEEHGLLRLRRMGEKKFITFDQLPDLEKFIRLHYDLTINVAGIEAITHLLGRVQELQMEVKRLRAGSNEN